MKKTESARARLDLLEAREMSNELRRMERKRKLPLRVKRLWMRSIQNRLDLAAGREPLTRREESTGRGRPR